MLADSKEDVFVSELLRHLGEKNGYFKTGNSREDTYFYERKNEIITDLIRRIDRSSHPFAQSPQFNKIKIDYAM